MGEWGTRDAAAMTIRDAAVTMVKQTGHLEKVGGLKGGHPEATVGSLMILYTTPFNPPPSRPELFGPKRPPYGIDIWEEGQGKAFSAPWDPFEVVRFKRGPWLVEHLVITPE